MERGLYIAASGMISDMDRQDVIANNLANVNTVGYKTDRVVNETFGDLFLKSMHDGHDVGHIDLGTRVAGTVTDFAQGSPRSTGNKTDVMIGGDGFFAVETPRGVTFTRNGQFTRSPDGFLTTQRGEFVLSTAGQRINLGKTGDPTITSDGRIFTSAGQLTGQLGCFTLDIASARKIGDNSWTGTVTGKKPADTSLRQGWVEGSGVSSVKEMIEMISTLRSYESGQRAIQAIDGTLDKAVNSVGVVQ